ncbi:hypothetical protein SprV_0200865200 [Sparganum proliferum]
MQKYKVGRPKRDECTGALLNQHLPTSDATNIHQLQTRQHDQLLFELSQRKDRNAYLDSPCPDGSRVGFENCRVPGVLNEYGTELLRAAEERNRRRDLERLRDRQEELTHIKTCKDLWAGRSSCAPTRVPNSHHHFLELDNCRNVRSDEESRLKDLCPFADTYCPRAYEVRAPYGTDQPSEARLVTESQSNFRDETL